jgi:succinoglycan biosynthesis transport protein ExoP
MRSASLDQLKSQAASTNEQDVQLRALERDAKSQRDLLESYLAKYREASARDTINRRPPTPASYRAPRCRMCRPIRRSCRRS